MSRKLALSSALSVMLMAGFVLFGTPDAASQNGQSLFASPAQINLPVLPGEGPLLPAGR